MKQDDSTDTLLMILVAVAVGPTLLAALFAPVRDALVQWHVLVTGDVLIPLAEGVGLDLPRVLLLAALVGLVGLLLVAIIRRRAIRDRVNS